VDERLAACAQVAGPVTSTYRWQGAVERAVEWYCHCKTTRARWPALRRRIVALHPYAVPEIVLVAARASAEYGRWVAEAVSGER
jgi:periplasmic divalent cation tolerance protein